MGNSIFQHRFPPECFAWWASRGIREHPPGRLPGCPVPAGRHPRARFRAIVHPVGRLASRNVPAHPPGLRTVPVRSTSTTRPRAPRTGNPVQLIPDYRPSRPQSPRGAFPAALTIRVQSGSRAGTFSGSIVRESNRSGPFRRIVREARGLTRYDRRGGGGGWEIGQLSGRF